MIYLACLLVCVLLLSNSQKGNLQRIKPILYGKISTEPVPAFASLCTEYKCFCGASFLTTRLLLTAGHCIKRGRPFGSLKIRWGSVDESVIKRVQKVSAEYIHNSPPGFGGMSTDFGVLVLQKAVTIDEDTQLIDYSTKRPKVGTKIISYGHGMHESGDRSNRLKELEMTIATNRMYRKPCPPWHDLSTEAFFCAYSRQGAMAIGDSGGPAFVGRSFTQVGLLSRGFDPVNETYKNSEYWQFFVDINYPPIKDWIDVLKTYSFLDRA